MVCLVCLGVSTITATWAHSDHTQTSSTSDKQESKLDSPVRINKTGKDFEVVALISKSEGTLTLYVSETSSNRPVSDASIFLSFQEDPKIDLPQSERAGIYKGPITPKPLSQLSMMIKKGNLEENFIFTNVRLPNSDVKFPLGKSIQIISLLAILGIIAFRKQLKSLLFFSCYVTSALLTSSIALAHGDHTHEVSEDKRELEKQHQLTEPLLLSKTINEIVVPKELQFELGIITERVSEREIKETVSLVGHVISDPSGYARIQASQNARVLNDPGYPLPLTGQKVQKDQVILALQPTLGKIESTDQRTMLYKIESEIVQLRNEVYRKEQLGQYASKKELDNTRTDLERAIRQKEEIINKTFKPEYLKSPLDGIIADLHVRPGEVVSPEKTIVEVVDPRKLLVEAFVFDTRIADNLTGGTARPPLTPNKSISLKLIGISPKVSKEDQSIHVLFKAEEFDPSIKLDMAIEVLGNLRTSKPTLAVPKKAVIENANGTMVFVHTGPESFEARRVRVRRTVEEWAEIEEGLALGERIVTEGAYLLGQARE